MIISVSPLNLFVIENSFINYDYISNEFKNNSNTLYKDFIKKLINNNTIYNEKQG